MTSLRDFFEEVDPSMQTGTKDNQSGYDTSILLDPLPPVKENPILQEYTGPLDVVPDEPVITTQQQPLGEGTEAGTVVDIKDPAAASENKSAGLWIVLVIAGILLLNRK